MTRPTHVLLYPQNLKHNYQLAQQKSSGEAWAVVKADGYGHGARFCALTLQEEADGFAVACVDEAKNLRRFGVEIPILVMQGPYRSSEWHDADELNLSLMIHHPDQLDFIPTDIQEVDVWLKINSGMNRLGIKPSLAANMIDQIEHHPALTLTHIASHFACADDLSEDSSYVDQCNVMNSNDWSVPLSFCNSAALCRDDKPVDAISRPGIMLYGSSPLLNVSADQLCLKPVMSLQSALISIHTIEAGESVGYGDTWVADRTTTLGVVAIGYGDGYPRHAPNGTPLSVDGVRCPLVGRVSMDMLTVDVTDHPEARIGSVVECWGNEVDVDEVARCCDTIAYELFCQITPRVARIQHES